MFDIIVFCISVSIIILQCISLNMYSKCLLLDVEQMMFIVNKYCIYIKKNEYRNVHDLHKCTCNVHFSYDFLMITGKV
jgi:hypothetical protein